MNRHSDTKVIVGISGGVDSSVAANLLLKKGFKVEGLHMTNWDEDDDYCSAADDYQVARQVCKDLKIPLHRINFSQEYRIKVFNKFLEEISLGLTPNPDVNCNRYIKFGDFLHYASRLGADKIATGHFARIVNSGGTYKLLKGIDPNKDQTYFLHAIKPDVLSKVLFPVGELNKADVRKIANDRSLPNHARRDSTGICFIGERPFRQFLEKYISGNEGDIETQEGKVIGKHHGLMFYTLGQRQGLEIGGLKEHGSEPWYVSHKDIKRNVLRVAQSRDHPSLWNKSMKTEPIHWLSENKLGNFECTVKTRYRQKDCACEVSVSKKGQTLVEFSEAVWAVTPGQYAVFYSGDECLGGAKILST
ncbi:MAG: tRNA 2-thiouridine(34) synthase MnmA [Pseudomonadota bacterium]|nr:tRNA 2-thiouridine(34) synthase MnmA [Pseudomonadota bacterium]